MTKPFLKSYVRRSLKVALIFQSAWVLAILIGLLLHISVHVPLMLLMMVVLWVPALLELLTRTELPTVLKVHFSIFISAASVAGSAFGVYALIPHWDSVVHAYSGVFLAWFGLFAVQRVQGSGLKQHIPRWFTVFIALVTPLAFAAVWEICEFTSDTFLHTTTQAGLQDTILDMLSAGVGAVVAVVLIVWFKLPKSIVPR